MSGAARILAGSAIVVLVAMTLVLARYNPPSIVNGIAPDEAAGFMPLPASATAASSGALLARSPFDPARQPFARDTVSTDMPVQDVRLTGIIGASGSRRASLVINGEAQTVSAGDQTPLGVVAAVEADSITFEDGRRLGLFE